MNFEENVKAREVLMEVLRQNSLILEANLKIIELLNYPVMMKQQEIKLPQEYSDAVVWGLR